MRSFVITAVTIIFLTPLPVQSQISNRTEQNPTQQHRQQNLLQQGITAQAAGNHRQGEAAYREAIRLIPTDPIAHYNLGNALAAQSKVTEAIAAYQTAIQIDPANAKAHYNLGYWLSTQGATQQAIAAYRTAARLNPFEADTYYNLSLLLRRQSAPTETDLTEAEVMMSRAILLNPEYALTPDHAPNTETKSI